MKYSKIFISLLVAILLLACQTSDNKVKVGFLFANFDIPRWGLERDIFTKKINELGGKCSLLMLKVMPLSSTTRQ
jgi:ABC-type xylose transport system substrate-binding protein